MNRRIMENLPIALKEYINDFTVGPKKHWKKIYNNCLNVVDSDKEELYCIYIIRRNGFHPRLYIAIKDFEFRNRLRKDRIATRKKRKASWKQEKARRNYRFYNYFERLFPSSIPDWMFSYYEDEDSVVMKNIPDFSYYENEKMVKF